MFGRSSRPFEALPKYVLSRSKLINVLHKHVEARSLACYTSCTTAILEYKTFRSKIEVLNLPDWQI